MGTKKNLKKGEVLDFDNNAYDMLHRLNIEWPSLSIDFVCHDNPFSTDKMSFIKMNKYPYEVYTVQGSSNNTQKNSIYLTKWRKLHKTKYDDDPDVEGDSEDEDLSNDE
jgi:ribosome assembly protein RRB1